MGFDRPSATNKLNEEIILPACNQLITVCLAPPLSIWNLKGSVTRIVIIQLYCPLLKHIICFLTNSIYVPSVLQTHHQIGCASTLLKNNNNKKKSFNFFSSCSLSRETKASCEPALLSRIKLFILYERIKQQYHTTTTVINYCLGRRMFKSTRRDSTAVLNRCSVCGKKK